MCLNYLVNLGQSKGMVMMVKLKGCECACYLKFDPTLNISQHKLFECDPTCEGYIFRTG